MSLLKQQDFKFQVNHKACVSSFFPQKAYMHVHSCTRENNEDSYFFHCPLKLNIGDKGLVTEN